MKRTGHILFVLFFFLIGMLAIYNLPPIKERVDWRVADWWARFRYALSPPEEIIFVPRVNDIWATPMSPVESLPSVSRSTTSTEIPSIEQPVPSLIPSITLKPIPERIQLDGFRHEYQTWNNCGPATLGMALSFWGWEGDQRSIAAFTKPNPRDKNVMPEELAAYVEAKTRLEIMYRVGGDIELLKRLLANGFPVIIEKGFEGRELDGWMGHYVLATGYSDTLQQFTLQDSYYGPDQTMRYDDMESYWRAFNFTYLVIYPSERRQEVNTIMDSQIDEEYNNRYAAQKASEEIYLLTGRDQFFAWFNRGTNLVRLQDYAGAAAAYDKAFAIYPDIPNKERPWRMMWYQIGPYRAYYYTGRYQDVIELATTTLNAMSEPVLEESYYWRALARDVLGDTPGAIKDLQSALKFHPGFEPALAKLQQISTP
jgi:tetratricopeptide (TPR) repeat protein